MSKYYEKYLKPCPYCDGPVTDHSYDRRIVFKCLPCDMYMDYPGLLQIVVNNYPIPYIDSSGNPIDPKDVKCQEYYHQHANEIAIEKFNKWVDSENLNRMRDDKINKLLD